MARRNYIEDILSVRLRSELSPRWGSASLRLLALDVALQNLRESASELIKYFPIGVVAVLEAFFRSAIAELVDHGPPYSENAACFEKDKGLRLDFALVLAIQGKKITLGELVGHLVPCKSLEDIDRNMSTVLQTSFLERLTTTTDRWAVEVEGAERNPIIQDVARIFGDVEEIFRLRHVYCHEIADLEKPDPVNIRRCFESSSIFLKAADQLIWDVVAPGAPLTQSAMNQKASEDFHSSSKALDAVLKEMLGYLNEEDKKEFLAAQVAWEKFRELDAMASANRWGRGGTIWGTLHPRHGQAITESRLDDLKRELAVQRKSASRAKPDGS